MFKVAKKWDLSILEEYGFKHQNALYNFYEYKYNFSMIRIAEDTREMYVFENTFTNELLKVIYKLIKNGIIEEVNE